MSDEEKILAIAKEATVLSLLNLVTHVIAENSGCKEFVDYVECVIDSVHNITSIVVEGVPNED